MFYQPTPSPPPQSICKAGDIFFKLRKYGTTDCQLCKDGCNDGCISRDSTLTDQVCDQDGDSLLCKCCCAGTTPPPSPEHPSPLLPPFPSPSLPPPTPQLPPLSPPSPSPPRPPICPEPCCPTEIQVPVPGHEPCRYGLLPRAPLSSLPHTPGSMLFAAI
ncbi:hypothetical protein MKX03_002336 [Papaver bracteatum]|nr:hypothetical protein MKX03_002336 [Papaver bracteatum]